MPILGFKKSFKNIKSIQKDIFTINFKVNYNEYGFLNLEDEQNNYFDVGDINLLLDKTFSEFNETKFKEYDNGIYILSICKYIVDKVPYLYSINYETTNSIDTYLKQEVIEDYNKNTNKKHN